MNPPKFMQNFIQYMYDYYSKDCGKLLVHMGALATLFGSIAQVMAVITDKKLDKDQKKFLLPQEGADAFVNVTMTYTVCDLIKRLGDKIVEKGKFLTDDLGKAIINIKPELASNIKDWKNIITTADLKNHKLTELLNNPKLLNVFKGCSDDTIKNVMPAVDKALDIAETHKNNVGIVTSIAASVLAANIITPYLRNIIASKLQKRSIKKEAVEIRKRQITENITTRRPLPPSFKAFKNYNPYHDVSV